MKYNSSILKNGLKVISSEIKDSEVANISIWFKAGYGYEFEEECGYTHLFEHLLLCGTERRPDQYAVNIEKDKIGAYSNGYTFKDQLYFLIQSGRDYIDQMFDLLSDTILNSLLKDNVIENEKNVVINELKRMQGDRVGSSNKVALQNFFNGNALGKHILISGDTVQRANQNELKSFYKKFCVPNRAAMIISSSLPHEKIVSLCEKYFGSWNSQLSSGLEIDKKIDKKKYLFYKDSAPQTIISINFYGPEVNNIKDSAALELIANYLGYGFTGILVRELRIKRGLIYSINASNYPFENLSQFNIWTQTNKPQEVFDLINNIISELPISFNKEALEYLKVQEINSFNRRMSNPINLVEFLGRSFAINSQVKNSEEYIQAINSVSYEDIINAVKKYLVPDNRFVFIQGPEEIKI